MMTKEENRQTNKQTEKVITEDRLISGTNGLLRGAVQSCHHKHYQTKKTTLFRKGGPRISDPI